MQELLLALNFRAASGGGSAGGIKKFSSFLFSKSLASLVMSGRKSLLLLLFRHWRGLDAELGGLLVREKTKGWQGWGREAAKLWAGTLCCCPSVRPSYRFLHLLLKGPHALAGNFPSFVANTFWRSRRARQVPAGKKERKEKELMCWPFVSLFIFYDSSRRDININGPAGRRERERRTSRGRREIKFKFRNYKPSVRAL